MGPRKTGAYPKSEAIATSWLKPDQVEQLRDACVSSAFHASLQDRNDAIVAVLYDLGLRRSELAALDVDNYDRDEGTVYLPAAIQKGEFAQSATLRLGEWGADASRSLNRFLRDRDDEYPALIPSQMASRATPKTINNVVKKAAVVADVRPQLATGGTGTPADVSSHTLRHSVAYRIIQVDEGRLEDVQLRLRHENRSTTDQIYSHLVPR